MIHARHPGLRAEADDLVEQRRAAVLVEMRRHLVEEQHRRHAALPLGGVWLGAQRRMTPLGPLQRREPLHPALLARIEAARLEGLSEIGIFFRMFIPIMRSTYGAAMTVTFMNAWNSYLWPKIVFQNNSSITMPMLVANLKSGYSVDYGMLMLGVLICTLPTAIIFLCLQKSFANGITGAVK